MEDYFMPNWCYNSLSGPKEDLEPYIKNGKLDFNLIIPEPQSIDEVSEKYIGSEGLEKNEDKPWFNWYNWHLDFWGCKWNADTMRILDNGDTLTIDFQTPWSAPQGIIEFFKNQEFFTNWVYEEEINPGTHYLDLGFGECEEYVEEEDEYDEEELNDE